MADVQRLGSDGLQIERLLDASPETVWRWITDPELRKLWFAGGTAPQEGGEIELLGNHDLLSSDSVPYPPEYRHLKGAVTRERVLLMEPPHLLTLTWGNGREGLVTFELSPEPGSDGSRTRLVLTHRGISGPPLLVKFGGGWLAHLTVLEARVGGDTVTNFWALHRACERAVGLRTA